MIIVVHGGVACLPAKDLSDASFGGLRYTILAKTNHPLLQPSFPVAKFACWPLNSDMKRWTKSQTATACPAQDSGTPPAHYSAAREVSHREMKQVWVEQFPW